MPPKIIARAHVVARSRDRINRLYEDGKKQQRNRDPSAQGDSAAKPKKVADQARLDRLAKPRTPQVSVAKQVQTRCASFDVASWLTVRCSFVLVDL